MSGRNIVIHLIILSLIFGLVLNVSYAADYYANPWNFQNLIDNAHDGDTIWFQNGNYNVHDTLQLYSSLRLIAQNPGGAVLRAASDIESIIKVKSPEVTISGFVMDCNHRADFGIWGGWGAEPTYNGVFSNNRIINYNDYAIMMDKSAYSVFDNNIVDGGRLGIAVDNSLNITVRNNQISGTQLTGLYLYNSPLSTVSGNTVVGCGQDGILIENSGLTMVTNNQVINNAWSGISLNGSSYSVILENTVTGNHGNGIGLLSSDESYVVINIITSNGLGIGLYNSRNNNITDNNVTGNNAGINIVDYTNNVARNIINNNQEYGISLISNGNSIDTSHIIQNLVTANGYGIEIVGDDNNIQTSLLEDNWVLSNDYMLRIQGNNNNYNGSSLFGNTNGIIVVGDNNHLSNITAVYNSLTGITINGLGNSLNGSLILNNTNGIIVTGLGNNITANYVLNNTGTGIFVSGTNLVTGNIITQNNGSGLVLQTDNNNMNLTQVAFNILTNNNQGVTILGDGNNINPLLVLLNILLNNNYELIIQGNNNQLHNTSITSNENGIQINGNENSLNNITIHDNNQTGLIVNGNQNQVNSSKISSNTDGVTIKGNQNNLTENNVLDNNHTGVNITGNQNNLTQNNITGNRDGVMVNGSNNTLQYNRISQNSENNLRNNGNGTVDAQYNWWGRNTPTRVNGPNTNTNNYVVATQTVEGAGNGIMNTGQLYNVFIILADSQGNALEMAIPSFLIHFYLDGGDVYPTTATITNNTAQTQIQIFHPGTYTLRMVLDEETLTTNLKTPANAQSFTPIKRTTTTYTGVGRYYCGPETLNILLGFLGFNTSADELARLAGTTSQGTTFYGMIQAATHFGVTLNGVQLDAGLLKSGDIVLLNVDGYYHYSFIIQRIGDLIVLQDPAYGIIILNSDDFTKIYTGYALTTSSGLGVPLSSVMLNNLAGGVRNPLIDPSDQTCQNVEAWWNDLTPKQREEIKTKLNGNYPFPDNYPKPSIEEVIIGLLAIGVVMTLGGGLLLIGGIGGLVAIGTGITELITLLTTTVALTLRTFGQQITQWGIRNSRTILQVLRDNLPKIGVHINSRVSFIFDLVSRVTFPLGPNPVNTLILGVETLAPRVPWLKLMVDSKPWTYLSRLITIGDVVGLGTQSPGLSDQIWNVVKNGGISPSKPGVSDRIWDIIKVGVGPVPNLDYLKNNFIKYAAQNIPGAKNIVAAAHSSYQTIKTSYEAVKSLLGGFSNGARAEIASFSSKGPGEYFADKIKQGVTWFKEKAYQAANYYGNNIKPLAAKYIQPLVHRFIDPVINNPIYKAVNSHPIVNKITSGLGCIGNKLGIW